MVWALLYSVVGICSIELNWVGTDGILSSHNNAIRSCNLEPHVEIDNGSCESYQLATSEQSELQYFPYRAATQSGIAVPLLYQWLVLNGSCWPPEAIAQPPNHLQYR